jgi:hypothetical protein
MDFSVGFETLVKMIVVGLIFFATGYRVVTALFEREISASGGLILIGGLIGLAAGAVSSIDNESSLLFFLSLVGMFAWLGAALVIPEIFLERERKKMLNEDLTRSLQGIAFDPNNVAAYCMLADTYRKMGKLDLAIENYRKALELDPTLKREKLRLESSLRDLAALQSRKSFRRGGRKAPLSPTPEDNPPSVSPPEAAPDSSPEEHTPESNYSTPDTTPLRERGLR